MARESKGGGNAIAAIVALLAVGGFMAWLMMQEPAPTVAVVEPSDTTANPATAADEPGVTVVTAEELNTTTRVRELRGQEVRIESIPVVSAMGSQLFWVELPGGAPFLIKLDSTLVAAGTQAPSSGNYRIVGRILEKTPAVLTEWQQAGVLRNDGDKMQAEFGSSYIEARRVEPAGA